MSLAPCRLCGGENTRLDTHYAWNGGTRPSTIISVELKHWCESKPGYPGYITLKADTEEAVIERWNAGMEAKP